MAARTARIELRAAERAEQVIAASSATVVPSDWFDSLWDALDAPPSPNEALRVRAARAGTVTQR